jgi:4-amino-4-deoxychorismate lyase
MGDSETTFVFLKETASWEATDHFRLPNRGIQYGDGIFETMVFDGNSIRFLENHQHRLSAGMETLGMLPYEVDFLKLVEFLAKRFSGQQLRVRWTLFRAGLGRYTPLEHGVEQFVTLERFQAAPSIKQRAGVSQQVRLMYTVWSRCKTLNALPYVLAGLERQKNGWDEIILLDQKGKISEAGASTVFWEKSGQIFTPSLSCGCIAGVSRAVILQKFSDYGHAVNEGEFDLSHLLEADRVWTSNVTGISYLESLESSKFSTERIPLLEEIFD